MRLKEIRILIVEDHAIVRMGLRSLLSTEEGIEVVGEASDGRRAVELAQSVKPDVVLMDLVMPELSGIDAIREMHTMNLPCRILVLTSFGTDDMLLPAIKAGAAGYVLKDTSPEVLTKAIREVARGEVYLDAGVTRLLLRAVYGDHEATAPDEPLTKREVDVLRQLGRGLSNKQIGARLFISSSTVRTHVSSILGKLGLSNRTEAALYALRMGITSVDEIDSNPK